MQVNGPGRKWGGARGEAAPGRFATGGPGTGRVCRRVCPPRDAGVPRRPHRRKSVRRRAAVWRSWPSAGAASTGACCFRPDSPSDWAKRSRWWSCESGCAAAVAGATGPPICMNRRADRPTVLATETRLHLHPRHMRGDALPSAIAKLPVVGVAASTLCTVRFLVTGARVDNREVAKNADHDIMLADILD